MRNWLEIARKFFEESEEEAQHQYKPPFVDVTPEATVRRAQRADAFLNNPVTREALDALEAAIISKWTSSEIRDHEGQHELRLLYQSSRDFRRILETYVQNGKIVLHRVKLDEKKRNIAR